MKRFCISLLFLISVSCWGQMEIPAALLDRPETILNHTGYTVSFNVQNHTANWSAWILTKEHIQMNTVSRSSTFSPDKLLPKIHQVTSSEYTNTGYDRGHLCPAADMYWDEQAMADCFLMSNICPQNPDLNRISWKMLETLCRKWVQTEGTLYIVCGPVYLKRKEEIGYHKIRVPDGYFKVILSLRDGNEKAIGFYYENNSRKMLPGDASVSVDEIEIITGMDFFHLLPDDQDERLERNCNILMWK